MTDKTNDPVSGVEAIDPMQSRLELTSLRDQYRDRLEALREVGAEPVALAVAELDLAEVLNGLGEHTESWPLARAAFNVLLAAEHWQEAVEACDVLYGCEQPDSIAALGMGVWLAVTYPIDPQTTVALLQRVVEETPDKADGGAVAAVTAHYIADLRGGEKRESLMFFTTQLIAQVAKRHRNIDDQEKLNMWMEVLELNNPEVFLPRMSRIIDAIVGGKWWFDRDELRARLPVN